MCMGGGGGVCVGKVGGGGDDAFIPFATVFYIIFFSPLECFASMPPARLDPIRKWYVASRGTTILPTELSRSSSISRGPIGMPFTNGANTLHKYHILVLVLLKLCFKSDFLWAKILLKLNSNLGHLCCVR